MDRSSETTAAAPTPLRDSPLPTPQTLPATLGAPVAEQAAPERLRLASIGVDVVVVPVGVEAGGAMEVPPPDVAGWYRFGPVPGAEGSSVLAAHVDYDGRPGAFFRLRDLAVGDPVEITMSDGSDLTLIVTRLTQVAKADLADRGVFDRSGQPRVALITCGGEFDRSRRTYEDNVVVIAEAPG